MINNKIYIYIKRSLNNKFITFNEPLRADEYNNLGTTWQDYLDNKWVLLNDILVTFHKNNPTASIEEVWNAELTPKPDRTLELAKREKNRID